MLISPIINNYQPKTNYRPTFKAHYDQGQIRENVGDGVRYSHGHIHNYSILLRNFRLFLELPKLLEEKFPNGAKIYDYGCSVGYEPVSLDLGLHNYFPKEQVKKYTPIIARDNNPYILREAKRFKLKFEKDELERLAFLKNINQEEFFHPHRKGIDGQLVCGCSDRLKKDIIFEHGDLFDDLKYDRLSDEPCVVLLRNSWQYMTKNGKEELSDLLFEKLKSGSIVIIGSHDVSSSANECLLNSGFKNIKGDYEIKDCEYPKLEFICNGKKEPAPSDIELYCFEKP